MLTDAFGRVHDYLRISLTERCNLRCFYCMPPEGVALSPKEHIMQADEVIELARVFTSLGVKKIRLTGGEPLVRKDINYILEELGRLGPEIAISTNGVMLDHFLPDLQKFGIRHLNISLDTLNEQRFESITRRNYFPKVISGIERAVSLGMETKVNVVLIKEKNEDEILSFIEWTKDLPLNIRFIEFMPFQGNNWNWEKGMGLKEILDFLEAEYGKRLKKRTDKPNDTSRNYAIEGYRGSFGIISTVTNPFCDSCNRIRLTADGKMKNCLFSGSETDLLSALRRGECVETLIHNSLMNKKKVRGGKEKDEDFFNSLLHSGNRSMVMIGG